MKERDFIAQNKQKWADFEKELSAKSMQPDKVSRYYIDTIDDLSFARTNYPNRLVRQYLNGISQVLSLMVYKSQQGYGKHIVRFWKRDLPVAMYEARWQLLLAFFIMALSFGIGVFSTMHDETFPTYILGEQYMKITMENIEKGDPMAIYKDKDQAGMFLSITYNNIMVSVQTYLLSLFLGIGTLIVLIFNGIMLGSFQYFFYKNGLLFESSLTLWQHGVVEISCIILAGTAGLVLARGILFPGTYSRIDAFRLAGRKSLIIMLGLMPLLVYSGAVEGFVTRYTEMHWIIRLTTIVLSVCMVLLYFVWYPRKVALSLRKEDATNMYLNPMKPSAFSFQTVEKIPVILWKAPQLLFEKKNLFTAIALLIGLAVSYIAYINADPLLFQSQIPVPVSIYDFFNTRQSNLLFTYNLLITSASLFTGMYLTLRIVPDEMKRNGEKRKTNYVMLGLYSLLIASLITSSLTNGLMTFCLILILPFLILWLMRHYTRGGSLLNNLLPAFQLMSKGFVTIISIMSIYIGLWLAMSLFIEHLLHDLVPLFLSYVLVSNEVLSVVNFCTLNFLIVFLLCLFYTLLNITLAISYFSIVEIQSARHLKEKINTLFPGDGEENKSGRTILTRGQFY